MMKKLSVLMFLATLFFFNCSSPNVESPISEISVEFPTSEKLELKFFNKYNALSQIEDCFVDDSVLWVVSNHEDHFGYCFDLTTGAQLSVIGMKGKASYEFNGVNKILLSGDSIQFHTDRDVIKTFAKKDIIEDQQMDQRKFSSTPPLDTIFVCEKIKLPNGSVLATMCGAKFGRIPSDEASFRRSSALELNKQMVAVLDSKEVNSYKTIHYEKFNITEGDSGIEDLDFKIKHTFALSHIGLKSNDMAVFSLERQFLLYTFDLNSRKVVKEKSYANLLADQFSIVNDRRLRNLNMKCNDNYIVCYVNGYLSKEDKESKTLKNAIFVFDWDLNPIKKFDLPCSGGSRDPYFISEDCQAVYFYKMEEDGLTLSKADLNY